jgi:hypothetical protein
MAQSARDTIERIVRNRLSTDAVDAVWVREGEDNDGNQVLRITVVLKKPLRSVNRREMIALTRHIRSAIRGDRFPLVEFLSMSDARKREAA